MVVDLLNEGVNQGNDAGLLRLNPAQVLDALTLGVPGLPDLAALQGQGDLTSPAAASPSFSFVAIDSRMSSF